MTDVQRQVLTKALGLLRSMADEAAAFAANHSGTEAEDKALRVMLADLRETSHAIEASFELHLGARELIRIAEARAALPRPKLLSSSRKNDAS